MRVGSTDDDDREPSVGPFFNSCQTRRHESADAQELGDTEKIRKVSGIAEMSEPLHHGFRVSDREPTGDCHYAYDPCCRYPKQELLRVHRFAFFVSGVRLILERPNSREICDKTANFHAFGQ